MFAELRFNYPHRYLGARLTWARMQSCRARGALAPAQDRAEGFDERCPENGPRLRKAVPSSVLPKVERRKAIRGPSSVAPAVLRPIADAR